MDGQPGGGNNTVFRPQFGGSAAQGQVPDGKGSLNNNPQLLNYGSAVSRDQQMGADSNGRGPVQLQYGDANNSLNSSTSQLNQSGHDLNAASQDAGQQKASLALAAGAANGTAPSQAAALQRNTLDQGFQQQLAGAASARGGAMGQASAQRDAAQGQAAYNQQGANSIGALRANEMATARSEYGNQAGALRTGDINTANASTAAAGQYGQNAQTQAQMAQAQGTQDQAQNLLNQQNQQFYEGQASDAQKAQLQADSSKYSTDAGTQQNQANVNQHSADRSTGIVGSAIGAIGGALGGILSDVRSKNMLPLDSMVTNNGISSGVLAGQSLGEKLRPSILGHTPPKQRAPAKPSESGMDPANSWMHEPPKKPEYGLFDEGEKADPHPELAAAYQHAFNKPSPQAPTFFSDARAKQEAFQAGVMYGDTHKQGGLAPTEGEHPIPEYMLPPKESAAEHAAVESEKGQMQGHALQGLGQYYHPMGLLSHAGQAAYHYGAAAGHRDDETRAALAERQPRQVAPSGGRGLETASSPSVVLTGMRQTGIRPISKDAQIVPAGALGDKPQPGYGLPLPPRTGDDLHHTPMRDRQDPNYKPPPAPVRDIKTFSRDDAEPAEDVAGYQDVEPGREKTPFGYRSDEKTKTMGASEAGGDAEVRRGDEHGSDNTMEALEQDANRRMQGSPWTYKDDFRSPGEAPGQLHYGTTTQKLESNPLTATAVRKDPKSGLGAVDMPSLMQVQGAGIASLQKQVDKLKSARRF